MGDVRRVVFDKAKNLWVYEDNGESATLADTMASLKASLVGTTWEAKDGKRVVRVERDQRWNGIRSLEIINLETRRVSSITAEGLFRKFYRATPFN